MGRGLNIMVQGGRGCNQLNQRPAPPRQDVQRRNHAELESHMCICTQNTKTTCLRRSFPCICYRIRILKTAFPLPFNPDSLFVKHILVISSNSNVPLGLIWLASMKWL